MPAQRSSDGVAEPLLASDRLFFAIYPDASAAARIGRLTRELHASLGLKGKPIAQDRLHVTLQFLGSFAGLPRTLADAAASAAASLDAPAFGVAFDHVASFRGRARNRPFVLLGGDEVMALKGFRRSLRSRLAEVGVVPAREPAYTPHVTLLYDACVVEDLAVEPIAWRAGEWRLVHSRVGLGKHVTLGRWPLRI